MMPSLLELYELPFEIIAMLAAGFLCYRAMFIGRDAPHDASTRILLIFMFGSLLRWAVAAAMDQWAWLAKFETPAMLAGGIILGLVWRRFGSQRLMDGLRGTGLIDHDGQPNVWRTMMARQLAPPNRLVVQLTSGVELMCGQLAEFNDAPMGPCLFGEDGSIALYATDVRWPGEDDWTTVHPFDAENAGWGYEMTFVPASQVARIDVTRPA